MGLLDFFSGIKAPEMPKFDMPSMEQAGQFLTTPQGQALLSGIASYAVNARRGTPINNIGRGLMGGTLGYQNAINAIESEKQKAFEQEYKQKHMQYMYDALKPADVRSYEYGMALPEDKQGQYFGLMSPNKNMPSTVQEWEYFNKLPPEAQDRYLMLRRAPTVIDQGGQKIIYNPVNPSSPLQTFPMQMTPQQSAVAEYELPSRSGSYTWTAPNGKIYSFPDEKSKQEFLREIGKVQ